jgi:hypothetical protein
MPGRLKLVKPHILLEKGAQIDSQPVRQPQKDFPFLLAQLLSRHKSFILELCRLLPERSNSPSFRSSIQKFSQFSH